MGNNVWNQTRESVNRFYFTDDNLTGGTTYISGGPKTSSNTPDALVILFPAAREPSSDAAIIFKRTMDDVVLFKVCTNGQWRFLSTQYTASDIRIKKQIEDINDDTALQMILTIEPKTYKYIDGNKSKDRVYGFIAQQIKQVIPEAVAIDTNIIPNIYKLCRCEENKRIYVVLPITAVGKLMQLEGIGQYKIVLVEDEYIEVEKHMESKDIPDGDNMVYGYEIDDFHSINKEYIFTLNVCATQELHRRILSQEQRIQELEAKVERLLNNLPRILSQEQRIQELEAKMSQILNYISL